MKILIILSLLIGTSGIAAENQAPVAKEGAITLDCDAEVDGAVCPSKYATKAGLLDDTNGSESSISTKPSEGAE